MTSLINSIDQTINFNEQTIRIVGSYDKPLFVAIDICKILGLKNVTDTLRSIPDKWKQICALDLSEVTSTARKTQELNCINEAGLYKLIMRSNKPIAQKFQEVVCEEILPSLRKKGEYKIQSIIDNNNKLEIENNKLLEENKQFSRRIFKKNKKTHKPGDCVYIVLNENIKNEFKFGYTDDINKRINAFNTSSPDKFTLYKNWYTRFNKKIERLVQDIFEMSRVSLNNEWFDMNILDKIVEYIDFQVELTKKYDQRNPLPEPSPILIFIDNNRTPKKKCIKCLLGLSLTEFYLKDKNIKEEDFDVSNEEELEKYMKLKYRNICKKCCNEQNKDYNEKLKENQNYNKKECIKCHLMLTYENFYKQNGKDLYDFCIKCYNEKNNLINSKQCVDCKLILPTENFGIHSGKSLRNKCKKCRNNKVKNDRTKESIICEFCNKEIKYKFNIDKHVTSKLCLKSQGKEYVSKKRNTPLVNIRSKVVIQLDINTQKELKKYNSVAEASFNTNIGRTNIEKCCNGRNKTAGGFIWKYEII